MQAKRFQFLCENLPDCSVDTILLISLFQIVDKFLSLRWSIAKEVVILIDTIQVGEVCKDLRWSLSGMEEGWQPVHNMDNVIGDIPLR